MGQEKLTLDFHLQVDHKWSSKSNFDPRDQEVVDWVQAEKEEEKEEEKVHEEDWLQEALVYNPDVAFFICNA